MVGRKSPFGSKKSGFKSQKPAKKRPEGRPAQASNYRQPPVRKPGVPTGAVIAIAAPLLAIMFFVIFGSRIFQDTTDVEIDDPNVRFASLKKRASKFRSDYNRLQKEIRDEVPGAESRSKALLNRMYKWIEDWDKAMQPLQDDEGNLKEKYQGLSHFRAQINTVIVDSSKSKGFFDD